MSVGGGPEKSFELKIDDNGHFSNKIINILNSNERIEETKLAERRGAIRLPTKQSTNELNMKNQREKSVPNVGGAVSTL